VEAYHVTATLTEATVVQHLRAREIIGSAPAEVRVLSGGVSSATFLVSAGGTRCVVKQPLPFLAVADEWPARLERAGVEAAALRVLERLTPGRLPRLLDYDEDRFVLVMSAAPASWTEWRMALLAGSIAVPAAATLGHVLGTWHAATARDPAALGAFQDLAGFVELRGDPYHRTVAARRPDLAGPVSECLAELLSRQTCLVHGDFSPKNVLVGQDSDAGTLWVLDFEVAHAGNPVFDVAFLLHHLAMKAIHLGAGMPSAPARLRSCAEAFLACYAEAGGPATDEDQVVRHTGALLLARVHGKSPTAYLTTDGAAAVSGLGARAVRGELAGGVAALFPAV
jgi:Phosphotransferase enzyme family